MVTEASQKGSGTRQGRANPPGALEECFKWDNQSIIIITALPCACQWGGKEKRTWLTIPGAPKECYRKWEDSITSLLYRMRSALSRGRSPQIDRLISPHGFPSSGWIANPLALRCSSVFSPGVPWPFLLLAALQLRSLFHRPLLRVSQSPNPII